jgi:hypothetical protein
MGQGMQFADMSYGTLSQNSHSNNNSKNTNSQPNNKSSTNNSAKSNNTNAKPAALNEFQVIKTTKGHFAGAQGATLCHDGMTLRIVAILIYLFHVLLSMLVSFFILF